jgi:hypothetical protein
VASATFSRKNGPGPRYDESKPSTNGTGVRDCLGGYREIGGLAADSAELKVLEKLECFSCWRSEYRADYFTESAVPLTVLTGHRLNVAPGVSGALRARGF